MGSNEGQTYCLRWNNHKANLVEILDALIKMESYVDCTLVVEDQIQFKAHRVVLAANSPYFQSILQDVPMDHCSILIPGVQAFEMRALLEYMYTGEVNVTQSQIPKIMKIAEQLEVKGLFDMADLKEKFNRIDEPSPPHSSSTSNTAAPVAANKDSGENQYSSSPSSAIIPTSTNLTPPQTSISPPSFSYKSQYSNMYAKSPGPSTSDRHAPWPISPHLPSTVPSVAAAAMLSSVYEAGPDMNPLKRKKISSMSSMLMSRDTPILRNVLAQSHAIDSPQPMPLVCPPLKLENRGDKLTAENCNGADYKLDQKLNKYEEPHSPYTDKSFEDDCMDMPPNYGNDSRLASYVPQQQQKPEWKRYKQYTRSDILSAIECVRNGMSALQASRKYGVPSRTLYDKVKKLGITTGRPMNRTIKRSPSNSGGQGFHFGLGGSGHPYGPNEQILQHIHEASERERDKDRDHHHLAASISHPAAALLDPAFLQQAFEARGNEIGGREALHAMALAAAAHAAANGISTSPGANGPIRSPSPMKYPRPHTPPASRESDRDNLDDDEEDRVEDLSVGGRKNNQSPILHTPISHNSSYSERQEQRHPQQQLMQSHHHQLQQQQPQTGVIVPPITKLSTNGGDDYSPPPDSKQDSGAIEDSTRG